MGMLLEKEGFAALPGPTYPLPGLFFVKLTEKMAQIMQNKNFAIYGIKLVL